jgi:hypothetical protein
MAASGTATAVFAALIAAGYSWLLVLSLHVRTQSRRLGHHVCMDHPEPTPRIGVAALLERERAQAAAEDDNPDGFDDPERTQRLPAHRLRAERWHDESSF